MLQELTSLIDVVGPRIVRNAGVQSVEQQSFDLFINASS